MTLTNNRINTVIAAEALAEVKNHPMLVADQHPAVFCPF
jgi:hypothetical protein